MKRKRLIIVLVAVVLLGLGLTTYSKRHIFFPSQQMKTLRQLETQLNLPKPKYRDEVDLGYNTDWKGAQHYNRHIALSYEDASVLDILRTRLLKDSWNEEPVDAISSNNYFSFTKGGGDAMLCVNGYSQPKNSDGIALYVSLKASGEYSCNPAPGV